MKLQKRDLVADVLGYRIVNLWKSLPVDVVSADSANCFKGRFDRLSGSKDFCFYWPLVVPIDSVL